MGVRGGGSYTASGRMLAMQVSVFCKDSDGSGHLLTSGGRGVVMATKKHALLMTTGWGCGGEPLS